MKRYSWSDDADNLSKGISSLGDQIAKIKERLTVIENRQHKEESRRWMMKLILLFNHYYTIPLVASKMSKPFDVFVDEYREVRDMEIDGEVPIGSTAEFTADLDESLVSVKIDELIYLPREEGRVSRPIWAFYDERDYTLPYGMTSRYSQRKFMHECRGYVFHAEFTDLGARLLDKLDVLLIETV